MRTNPRCSLYACYIGYITQAIINNLLPLLFVVVQSEFSLTVTQIGFLVTFNFGVQILTDLLAARYAEKIGYRVCIVSAHVMAAVGLVGLGIFPKLFSDPYIGLLFAVAVYAVGGGLIEVLVSPIVEALPLPRKEAVMSLLHSFYCWGHAGVVLLSTAWFYFLGMESWRVLAALWAVIPAANIFLFLACPIPMLTEKGEGMTMKQLFGSKIFWLFALLMLCAGASEQAMSQWSSFFAERGLRVSKTLGDLLGPCSFALLMGVSRLFYGIKGDRLPLKRYLKISGAVCIGAYLVAVFSPVPLLSLIGCGLCGLSVGIMWPGVFSLAARHCPKGGTAMFALLALAGDAGCSGGPGLVSVVAASLGDQLKAGLLAAVIFPLLLILSVYRLKSKDA